MFLLDTDHLVTAQQQSEPEYGRLIARVRQHSPTDFYVSIVSY